MPLLVAIRFMMCSCNFDLSFVGEQHPKAGVQTPPSPQRMFYFSENQPHRLLAKNKSSDFFGCPTPPQRCHMSFAFTFTTPWDTRSVWDSTTLTSPMAIMGLSNRNPCKQCTSFQLLIWINSIHPSYLVEQHRGNPILAYRNNLLSTYPHIHNPCVHPHMRYIRKWYTKNDSLHVEHDDPPPARAPG